MQTCSTYSELLLSRRMPLEIPAANLVTSEFLKKHQIRHKINPKASDSIDKAMHFVVNAIYLGADYSS